MKKKVLVFKWDGKSVHPYLISTSRAKHPVHMIEGGNYLTEDEDTKFNEAGDMGIFGLNAKDYKYFKEHLVEKEIEVEE